MFEGARSKIERAKHHVNDFETQFASFIDSKPYGLATDDQTDSGQTFLRLNLGEAARSEWALIIGDAIHNLRTALDHMTWDVVGHDGGTQDRNLTFPSAANRRDFEARCRGIKTPSASIKDLFKAREVFPGGKGNTLYSLHQLDIADKHIMLMPVVRAADISKCVVRNASGTPQMTMINTKFVVAGDTGHVVVAGMPAGCYIDPDDDAEVTPDAVLGPIDSSGGYIPIRSMLREFLLKTRKTIDEVEMSIR